MTDYTVHVVDESATVRDSAQFIIESAGMSAAMFPGADEFFARFDSEKPGCVLFDVHPLDAQRMEGLHRLARYRPVPVVVVTSDFADVGLAVQAIQRGAIQFVEKPFSDSILLAAIREALEIDAHRRRRFEHQREYAARVDQLTGREKEILELVVSGDTNKNIAHGLHISQKTVEVHRSKIMKKMGASNFANLIRMTIMESPAFKATGF